MNQLGTPDLIWNSSTVLLAQPGREFRLWSNFGTAFPVLNLNYHNVLCKQFDRNVWFQKISIPTPRMVIGNSKREGDVKGQNFLKEGMKLNENFQKGGGFQTKIPSLGGVWIFSGTTQ